MHSVPNEEETILSYKTSTITVPGFILTAYLFWDTQYCPLLFTLFLKLFYFDWAL